MDLTALSASNASAQASSTATSQLSANFDTFLTLLTAQLRNQDPLEPLDTEKFTDQLVQFANVEQSIQTNQHLEALLALQSASANETALAMVGRVATVETDAAVLGGEGAKWHYTLPQDASEATLQILDARGVVVATRDAQTSAGTHEAVWDGSLDNGTRAENGVYRLTISAVSGDDEPLAAAVTMTGLVSSVAFEGDVPAIEIAGQRFGVDLVRRVAASL